MARLALGKSKCSDWFVNGWDFITRTVITERVISCVVLISMPGNINNQVWAECHRINFLYLLDSYQGILTRGRFCMDLATLGLFTATTPGQYSPALLSVRKRLL